jgi:mannose-6-phosphate isomerase-like protein (cupin superfamily)
MRITPFVVAAAILLVGFEAQAQRRSGGGGSATLAIVVSDPSGAPIGDVHVTVQGPASRDARTERGRIAFENIPTGNYRLRFEKAGFVTLERELTARAGAPTDVKITLTPEPPKAPPPAPPIEPVAQPVDALPVTIDLPTFIEKNFIGRAAGKTSPLACGAGGPALLIQAREPIAEHMHVIAGEGSLRTGKTVEPMKAGVLIMVPRGVLHAIATTGRNPLELLSIQAGAHCG